MFRRNARTKEFVVDDAADVDRNADPILADHEIIFARVVLLKIVDVDPLRAGAAPRQRRSFGDDPYAMPARDESIRLSDRRGGDARDARVFEQIGEIHESLRAVT